MASKLTLEYDRVGDILYISNCRPYPEQESEELGDDVVGRLNPVTGHVENLEILFFSRRMSERGSWELPVTADLYPAPHD